MGTTGKRGLGTTISGATTGSLASVEGFRLGGGSVTYDDISTLADIAMKYISDQIDYGTLSVTLQYDSDDVDAIYDDIGLFQTWTLTSADGDTVSFSGSGGVPEIDWARQKSVGVSFDIKISGAITYTPGT